MARRALKASLATADANYAGFRGIFVVHHRATFFTFLRLAAHHMVAVGVAAGLERRGTLQRCFWLGWAAFRLVLQPDKGLAMFAGLSPAGDFDPAVRVGARLEAAWAFVRFDRGGGHQTAFNRLGGTRRAKCGVSCSHGSTICGQYWGRHVKSGWNVFEGWSGKFNVVLTRHNWLVVVLVRRQSVSVGTSGHAAVGK